MRLGSNVLKPNVGKSVTARIPESGVVLVAAKARYGKTSLVKNMLIQMSKRRKIIIFDFYGDGSGEYSALDRPNYLVKTSDCIDRLQLLPMDRCGWFLEDLDRRDLTSFGFTGLAGEAIEKVIFAAGNDPEYVKRVVTDFPIDQYAVKGFNEKYPAHKVDFWIARQTKMNMLSRFIRLIEDDIIIHPSQHELALRTDGKAGKFRLTWDMIKEKLSKGHLRINMNLKQNDVSVAQFYVGKILQKLRSWYKEDGSPVSRSLIRSYHPIIIVEESDKVFEDLGEMPRTSMSISQLEASEYVHKIQRDGFVFVCIVQDPRRLLPVITQFTEMQILGRIPSGWHEATEKLVWKRDRNYREFALVWEGSWRWEIFTPDSLSVEDVKEKWEPMTFMPTGFPRLPLQRAG